MNFFSEPSSSPTTFRSVQSLRDLTVTSLPIQGVERPTGTASFGYTSSPALLQSRKMGLNISSRRFQRSLAKLNDPIAPFIKWRLLSSHGTWHSNYCVLHHGHIGLLKVCLALLFAFCLWKRVSYLRWRYQETRNAVGGTLRAQIWILTSHAFCRT